MEMEHNHKDGERCMGCEQGLEAMHRWQNEMIQKFGWYAHFVPLDNDFANFHTHGIFEKFLHPDFQITVPLDPKVAHRIFHRLVDLINDEGKRFNPGDVVETIIQGFSVTFIKATENDRQVLRVILPDRHGNLSRESIESMFALQYHEYNEAEWN